MSGLPTLGHDLELERKQMPMAFDSGPGEVLRPAEPHSQVPGISFGELDECDPRHERLATQRTHFDIAQIEGLQAAGARETQTCEE